MKTTLFVFKVKDESLQAFFLKNLTNTPERRNDGFGNTNISCYHYLQDELIFKKDGDVKEGQQVVFELKDRSQFSNKELTNKYTYKAENYDDVSIKLKLIDFKITTK